MPQIIAYFAFQEILLVLLCVIILTFLISSYVLPNLIATRSVRILIAL